MPYRTAADPWAVRAPVAVSTGRRRPRPPRAFGAGIACVLLALGLGLGLRPELGPDDAPEVPASFVEVAPTPRWLLRLAPPASSNAGDDLDPEREPPPYDLGRALRSDEPEDGEPVPEGTGPARRRYVGPDPMTAGGTLRGRIFFVSDRRLRRYPSL
ncbi:MAG TPA: hypothetical protein VLT33_04275 [Labilithrix sp.]|nr:hypothetical protein [Labilithrix sp.]